MTKTFITLLISLITLTSQAQRLKKDNSFENYWINEFTMKAERAFEAKLYHKAIELYNIGYQKTNANKDEKQRIIFQIGICYQRIKNYKEAEIWIEKAVNNGHLDPLAILYLADVKKQNNDLKKALIFYEEYEEKIPDDPRGKDGIRDCKRAMKWEKADSRYEVSKNRSFNSLADDFSPAYAKYDYSIIYFTSARDVDMEVDSTIDATSGQGYTDLYRTIQNKNGKWGKAKLVKGKVNSSYNEGVCSFDQDFSTIYFTKCLSDPKVNMGCQIYKSEKKSKGWGEPVKIELAADSIVAAHPAVSADNQTMIFSSDMEGTLGGKDLWKCTYDKGTNTWSYPENLGANINTAGDEAFPVIRKNGTLYFASDGHKGMGGLDIYKAKRLTDSTFSDPINLKYPMNTTRDDFGITFKGDENSGIFSSNRHGGKGGDDLYVFNRPPIVVELEGVVTNETTEEVIGEAIVELIGDDQTVKTYTTKADGYYKFKLGEDVNYIIQVRKTGYISKDLELTTVGLMKSTTLQLDNLTLIDLKEPINLPNVMYEISSYKLKNGTQESLNQLVNTLNKYPKMRIQLRAHTDYSGKDHLNNMLSVKRAKSVMEYLIQHDISAERLEAIGFGESSPLRVSKKIAKTSSYEVDDHLTEEFLGPVSKRGDPKWQEGMQLNRRTEFFILSMDENLEPAKPEAVKSSAPNK
ncbi:MAG: OmpA family protein [Flavobacteriales bacterium]|nr:OmpA family protein [Flavobacteriales bacterium]